MKKYILFIALFLFLFVLFFELSKIIVVIKYGQGHEIIFGKNEVSEVTEYDPASKQIISSIITYRTILPDFSEVTGIQIKVLSAVKVISKVNTFKNDAVKSINIPLLLEKPVKLPLDFYLRPEVLYPDFILNAGTYFPKKASFDMFAGFTSTQPDKREKIVLHEELIFNKQKNLNISGIEQKGSFNVTIHQQTGVLNIATIHQLGNENTVIQTQNWKANSFNSLQFGSINQTTQVQKNVKNDIELNQSGFLNTVNQNQDMEIPGGYNTAYTNQNGAFFTSIQNQNGFLNHNHIMESGNENKSGNMSISTNDQRSNHGDTIQSQNSLEVENELQDNAEINKNNGSDNFADLNQNSIRKDLQLKNIETGQNRSHNTVIQTEPSGNIFSTISQTGFANNATVFQAKY